jgi:hypothetical protein
MLRCVALVRTEVWEEPSASIRVTRIGELGTTQAATSNRRTLRRNTFLVTQSASCYTNWATVPLLLLLNYNYLTLLFENKCFINYILSQEVHFKRSPLCHSCTTVDVPRTTAIASNF